MAQKKGESMKSLRKLLVGLLILTILVGCNNIRLTEENLATELTRIIDQSITMRIPSSQNHHRTLFSYYIPPSTGRRASTDVSTVLIIGGYEVVMNLNVSAIIIERHHPEMISDSLSNLQLRNTTFNYSGHFIDFNRDVQEFSLYLNRLDDGNYLLLFNTRDFTYLTSVSLEALPFMVRQLFVIARTTRVNHDEVVAAFSKREIDVTERRIVRIYQAQIPVSGALAEMIYSSGAEHFQWDLDGLEFVGSGRRNREIIYIVIDGIDGPHDVQTYYDDFWGSEEGN